MIVEKLIVGCICKYGSGDKQDKNVAFVCIENDYYIFADLSIQKYYKLSADSVKHLIH